MGSAPGPVEKLTGVFEQQGSALTGTLLSVTGDYGALHGSFDGESLVLTVFDGVHVYRFDGELLPDGTLAGEYRSRTNPPVPFRARKLDGAAAAGYLPPASGVVRAKEPNAPYVFAYPDSDGKLVSSTDARYAGKPVVVTFMGTWCPNCFDETPVLRDLAAAYGPKGVEVVSLSFEYTDDVERNRRQVKRFLERHRVKSPVLLAGTTKGAKTSQAVAQLEGWEGYPTTLFLDRRHRVVKTLSGFDGPATGERYAKAKQELEDGFKAILK
jgi:thiol-disulfide isomerase/thioredoxin